MQPTKRQLLKTLSLACVLPPLSSHAQADAPPAAVAQVMRDHQVAGMAIAVTRHGHQTFYNFGVASKATRRPVTSDTIFEIGSVSKTFTATLATYAQALGRLSLDDSPARFFPELQGSPLAKTTLINLGTHTAGGFPLQLPDEIGDRQQLMAWFAAWKPAYAAGTARSYANPSIGLLGMAAARAMDMPFQKALQGQLFARLGLHDSYLDVPPAAMARYAQGYDKADAPVRVNPGVLAAEAYGVKTTARDLIRFIELNTDPARAGGRLSQALRDTRTGYFKLGAMTQDLIWEQYDEPVQLRELIDGNAPAIASETHPVEAIVPPRPAVAAAWVNKTGATNGFGAYLAFVPAQQAGVVILANKNIPNEARVRLAWQILGR